MADPKLPSSVEREAEVDKTTSASPALNSDQRAAQERLGYNTQFQRDARIEQQKRDEVYIRKDGGRPRNVIEAGVGRPLAGHEVQRRLLLLNPGLIFEPSTYPGRICIKKWIQDPVLGFVLHYVCAMERGMMPEFSILNFIEEEYFDDATSTIKTRVKINEKNPETRGWRTVLFRLIRDRLISREAAERMFGLPSHDSQNWHEGLQ